MTETEEVRKKAMARMDIVRLYFAREMDAVVFTRMYNIGAIDLRMLKNHGVISAEDLDRWADACMEVGR